jgi:hypothetical protein
MNAHVTLDGCDYAKAHHTRNVWASNRLLDLLHRHHGKKTPAKVYLPALIYPDFVSIGFERAESRALALKAMADGKKKAWFKITEESAVGEITLRDVERACCKHFKITGPDLRRQLRTKEVVRRRSIAIYLARNLTEKSWPQISGAFGLRDHTSAIAAERRIAKQIKQNAMTCADAAAIASMLGRFV